MEREEGKKQRNSRTWQRAMFQKSHNRILNLRQEKGHTHTHIHMHAHIHFFFKIY